MAEQESPQNFESSPGVVSKQKDMDSRIKWGLRGTLAATTAYLEYKDRKERNQPYNVRSLLKSAISGYKEVIPHYLLTSAGRAIGLKIGNASLDSSEVVDEILDKPNHFLFRAVVAGPLLEEGLMRLIPYKLSGAKPVDDIDWKVGVATSLAFGFFHNLKRNENGKIVLDTEHLPLSQILGGLLLWRDVHRKGYLNAAARHAAFNSFSAIPVAAIGNYIKTLSPDDQAKVREMLKKPLS